MERLTDRTENGLICLNNDCKLSNPLLLAMEKLAEFEDFMEEQGFESLEELKDSYETIKKSQASIHSTLITINKELVKARQIIARHTIENQALKDKIQELELADLIRKKEK